MGQKGSKVIENKNNKINKQNKKNILIKSSIQQEDITIKNI